MADYKGLNIRFRGDTTDASKALHILSTEARTAQGNLQGIQNALKNSETNGKAFNAALKQFQLEQVGKQAEIARDRFETYGRIVQNLKNEHAELRAEIESTKSAMMGGEVKLFNDDGTAMNMKELAAHLNSVEEQERSVSASLETATRNMYVQQSAAQALEAQYSKMSATIAASETALGRFGSNAQEFGANLQSAGNALSSIGDKMTLVSGIAAMTFGRKIISSTEEFGNAISQLGGYLDIQGDQLEEMSDQALKWGKETQFSATEAANAMNELAKGGMTQAQISGGAMKATMELAAAGSLDMAQAASVAVQAIKTFGLDAADASSVADALAGAANKSTAEVTELANGFKYVGGWASMANWNINDVSGALALLSDHGLQSEMAGTALRNVMQRLAAPTSTAAKLMNAYGFSVRDSSGQMVSAVEMVRRLNEVFGQLGDQEKQEVLSKIFGARALPAAIALMDEGADKLQEYIDATTQAGYATEMAQNRMGDLGWALEYLRGEAETASVNFGQALAPTIIEVAHAIEDAMEWFNGLSDAQQQNIAKMALMVVAAGPVLSIVGHLTSGIGSLVGALGTGASGIATFTKVLGETHSITTAATTAFEGAGTAMAAMPVAITAAAIGLLAEKFKEVVDGAALASDATKDIYQIVRDSKESIEGASEEMDKAAESAKSYADVVKSNNESLKQSAEHNKELSESLKSMEEGISSAEKYGEVIERLSSAGTLTSAQQEELKQAVDKYNDATGSAIRITDAQSGKLNILTGDIDKVTEAYKRQAMTSTYTKLYNEAVEEQIRKQEALRKANKETGESLADLGNIAKTWLFNVQNINSLTAIANLADLWNMKQSYDAVEKGANDAAEEVDYFAQKLQDAGMSTDEYNQLLNDMGIAAKGAGDAASDAGDDADEAAQQAAQAMEDASKAAQKAMRRQHEAIYREAQRGYDAEYKAAQKAYDAEYKAQQKAYDAEYKELQKALDKEYKARQKAFDNVYKQRQKELDKQYDAYKKQLDAEEDALKKSLDAKYDQRKKALDAELAQLKKANDARLKQQKKADDEETKAFKAETDRRVKALQAEYKERLRLLELQYGGSDIDAQIKDLKNQTKAEQDEIKRRNENEKKAELEKAVEQAKTRRKRADAEKALNDYLAELAQEQREREREAQIERLEEQKDALKDELQAKKDALKEEYDARIEALKAQREAELEVIKEANDAEYENLKEQLDAVYQTRKEANDAKLQQIKDANQLELDAMKEQHTVLLDNMKERHSEQLELLKEQQQEQLDQIKEGQQAQLDGLKESQQAQLDALKESQQAQLDAMKQAQQDALQSLKDAQEDELDALKNGGDAMLNAARDTANGIEDTASKTSSNVDWMVKSGSDKMVENLKALGRSGGMQANGISNTILNNLRPIEKQPGVYTENGMKGVNAAFVNNKSQIEGNARNVSHGVESQFNGLPSTLGGYGSKAGSNLSSNLDSAGRSAITNAGNIADSIARELSRPANNSGTWGWDMLANFNDSAVSFWNNTLLPNLNNIGQSIANIFGHSTPKEGPLKGDDIWFYHFMQNLDDGLKRGTPMLMDTAYGIADGMHDAMSTDFMDDMIDNMRSKETALANQSRRMAEIVSENFDPYATGNYSVGYDVKPMAQLLTNGVTEALRSGVPQRQGATIVVKEMHVRDESDIRRVSQRLYQLEAQADRRGL